MRYRYVKAEEPSVPPDIIPGGRFQSPTDRVELDLPPDPPTLRGVVEELASLIDEAGQPLKDPAWKALRKKAREALEHDERLLFQGDHPLRIKHFITPGELDPGAKSVADLYESAGYCLDHAYSHDICGTVLLEGEDGRIYGVWVEAVIGLANPEYVSEVIRDYADAPDEIVEGQWLEWDETNPPERQEADA